MRGDNFYWTEMPEKFTYERVLLPEEFTEEELAMINAGRVRKYQTMSGKFIGISGEFKYEEPSEYDDDDEPIQTMELDLTIHLLSEDAPDDYLAEAKLSLESDTETDTELELLNKGLEAIERLMRGE